MTLCDDILLLQGIVLEICLLQFGASELLSRLFERQQSPFIFLSALLCFILCLNHLLKSARFPMTLDGRIHANQGLLVISLMGVLWCVIFIMILLLPQGLLDVDMQDTAQGIVQGWGR